MGARFDRPTRGRLYGFPKPAPADALSGPFTERLADWLVENGYPQELITLYNATEYTRIIGEFIDEAPADDGGEG